MSDLIKKLDENIPTEAVENRTQAGKQLSYLSGAYVINRLNEVLGQGNWSYFLTSLEKVYEGTVSQYSGDVNSVSYIARVWIKATINGKETSFEDVGYGDGTDKKNPGKAHELAVKEAVTDGLKRAAKNLGRSMGLGLYFKGDMYVGDKIQQESDSSGQGDISTSSKSADGGSARASEETRANSSDKTAKKQTSTVLSRKQIKAAFAVLKEQKKITAEAFTKDYTQGTKVDDLEDTKVVEVLTKLKSNFPELGLS